MKYSLLCDSCGSSIKDIDQGWVEWFVDFENGHEVAKSFRIVHKDASIGQKHGTCQHKGAEHYGVLADRPLSDLIGQDGLMSLLIFLKRFPENQDDVVELIKRIHIPDYEIVRHHLQNAGFEGVITPGDFIEYPFEVEIDAVKKWLSQE